MRKCPRMSGARVERRLNGTGSVQAALPIARLLTLEADEANARFADETALSFDRRSTLLSSVVLMSLAASPDVIDQGQAMSADVRVRSAICLEIACRASRLAVPSLVISRLWLTVRTWYASA